MKPSYDKNHFQLVEVIEKFGGTIILDLAKYGCPWDLLVAFRARLFLIEIKNPETINKNPTPWKAIKTKSGNEQELATRLFLANIPAFVAWHPEHIQQILFNQDRNLIAKPPKFSWK